MLYLPVRRCQRHDQQFWAAGYHFERTFGNAFEIGNMDVFAVIKHIAQTFGAVLQQLYRRYFYPADIKRLVAFDLVGNKARHSHDVFNLIGFGNKVAEIVADVFQGLSAGIDIQALSGNAVDFAQVVNTMYMVGMGMGVKHSIKGADLPGYQLFAQIRIRINQKTAAVYFNVSRGAGSEVFGIIRVTVSPAKRQRWDSGRRPCPQDDNFSAHS